MACTSANCSARSRPGASNTFPARGSLTESNCRAVDPPGPQCWWLRALRQATVDEFAVEGGSRFAPGRLKVLPSADRFAGTTVQLAERGVEQVIVPQCRVAAGFVQGADARPRAVDLGHHNRTVEQVHRRALDRQ